MQQLDVYYQHVLNMFQASLRAHGENNDPPKTHQKHLLINPISTVLHTGISQIWKTRFRTKPWRTQPTAPDGHQHFPPTYMTLLVVQ